MGDITVIEIPEEINVKVIHHDSKVYFSDSRLEGVDQHKIDESYS